MSPHAHVCGCGRLTITGARCPDCTRTDNARRNAKSKQHGITGTWWRRMRAAVIARDNHRCQHCGTGEAILTAHYKPGGKHSTDLDDYLTLCLHCHGARDAARAHLSRR